MAAVTSGQSDSSWTSEQTGDQSTEDSVAALSGETEDTTVDASDPAAVSAEAVTDVSAGIGAEESAEPSSETVELTPAHWATLDDVWYYYDAGDVLHTGWLSLDGNLYYFDLSTGAALTGWQNIDGNTYFFRTSAKCACIGVWTIGGVKYGFDENGVMLRNAWGMDSEGNHYYFGEDGVTLTGWQEIDGEMYFFRRTAKCACTGVWTIDGTKYCFDESGALQRSRWSTDSAGNIYYTDGNGIPATGWWEIDGNTYFFRTTAKCACTGVWTISGVKYGFDENGVMLRNAWGTDSEGRRYYFGEDGVALSGWQVIDGETYFFRTSAKCACTGVWNIAGTKYYFDEYGALLHSQWSTGADGNTYFVYDNGVPASGWTIIDGETYYFGTSSRKLYKGLTSIGGYFYYLDETTGILQHSGWYTDSAGNRYCLRDDGTALTGWQYIDGAEYYFSPSTAAMSTGWMLIDGIVYYFNEDGTQVIDAEIDGKLITANGVVMEGDGSPLTAEDEMLFGAQGYSSSTGYLMMTDVDNCKVGVFTGSRGNWTMIYYWDCTVGKSSTPTPLGTFSIGNKYYSFGSSSYTAYYGSTYYTETGTEWLFHSTLYQVDGYSTRDGRLGYHGSNGCIRLLTSNAKWVYENIPEGTTVVNY